MSPDPAPLVGRSVGRYRITRLLGEGGMGAVYLGEHAELGGRVAIKVVLPEWVANPIVAKRFMEEARSVNRVEHPGIIRIHDCGAEPEIGTYLVMEYLEGETLEQRAVQLTRLPAPMVTRIVQQAASALGVAHRAGIVHRDLKPSNIFLVRDPDMPGGERVKILDFGIAKLLEGNVRAEELTKTGAALGTPWFMSPEQGVNAKGVDLRTDIYSLGVIAYLLLSGKLPTPGDGMVQVFLKQSHRPQSLSELGVEVPAALEQAILRALEPDRERRFQTMEELQLALDRPSEGGPVAGEAAVVGSQGLPATAAPPVPAPGPVASLPAVPLERAVIPAGEGTLIGLGVAADPRKAATDLEPRPAVDLHLPETLVVSRRDADLQAQETVIERPGPAPDLREQETLIERPREPGPDLRAQETLIERPREPAPGLDAQETLIKPRAEADLHAQETLIKPQRAASLDAQETLIKPRAEADLHAQETLIKPRAEEDRDARETVVGEPHGSPTLAGTERKGQGALIALVVMAAVVVLVLLVLLLSQS